MKINNFIDHTLLKPEATLEDIKKLCLEAKENEFAAVCVNSIYVKAASNFLKDTSSKVCTVVGFPLGASPTQVKLLETELAIQNGAQEIDMVINISELKNKNYSFVEEDIKALAQKCHKEGAILKVIFETCLLTNEEIIKASQLATNANADFVKTSTGFSKSGATLEAVKLMKSHISDNMQVKASGGIRDLNAAKEMLDAGATRLGTSSGVKIIQGLTSQSDY